MNSKIVIESMKNQHITDIVNIESECFSEPWTYNGLLNELNNPNSYFIVALIEKKVVGYSGMHCILGDCYITNIAVSLSNRNKGIGKILLNSLLNYATKKNYNFISLEVRKSNIIAQKLYSKFNFKNVGIRKNFYNKPKEDAIIMTYYI